MPHQWSRSLLDKSFSTVILGARMGLGMTQEELASASGFTRQYISLLERGERSLGIGSLLRIASALHLDPRDLLGYALAGYYASVGKGEKPPGIFYELPQLPLRNVADGEYSFLVRKKRQSRRG